LEFLGLGAQRDVPLQWGALMEKILIISSHIAKGVAGTRSTSGDRRGWPARSGPCWPLWSSIGPPQVDEAAVGHRIQIVSSSKSTQAQRPARPLRVIRLDSSLRPEKLSKVLPQGESKLIIGRLVPRPNACRESIPSGTSREGGNLPMKAHASRSGAVCCRTICTFRSFPASHLG
jgi:hypothetical protein